MSPQVKEIATVQYTAPGTVPTLSYQNMGGKGLWLRTSSVWQGRWVTPSLPANFNMNRVFKTTPAEDISEFLKVLLPSYNRRGTDESKICYTFRNYRLENARAACQVLMQAAYRPVILGIIKKDLCITDEEKLPVCANNHICWLTRYWVWRKKINICQQSFPSSFSIQQLVTPSSYWFTFKAQVMHYTDRCRNKGHCAQTECSNVSFPLSLT